MASQRRIKTRNDKKKRLKKLRKKTGRNDSNGELIEKGRELLAQLLDYDAPAKFVKEVGNAIAAAMKGDPFMLEQFVEMVGEKMQSSPSTGIEFPFTSAKADGLLRQAWSEESGSAIVELCQQALAIDPKSADAMVLLGDQADDNSICLKWYRQASQVIDRRLTEPDLEPAVSACKYHMGRQLMERTLFADAFEIMSPVLEVNPDTVRLEMLQIALMLEWHDELYHVLGKGEPLAGLDNYVEAIAAFQIHGNSEVSRRLLSKGFRELPEVAQYITGQSTIPQNASNDPMSIIAVATAKHILPAMRTKPGLVKWVRDTLDLKLSRENPEDSSLESFDELPQANEVWEFHILRRKGKTHLLCVDEQGPIHMEVVDHSPNNEERRDFLIHAMRFPAAGEVRRPREICFDTRKTQQACRSLLENLDVKSSLLKKNVLARGVLKSLIGEMADLADATETPSRNKTANLEDLESISVSAGLIWMVSIHRPPIWITDQATPRRCWNILVVDASSGAIVGLAQSITAFSAQNIFDELANMMLNQNLRPECLLIAPRTDPGLFTNFSQVVPCEAGDDSAGDAMLQIVHQMVKGISQCRLAIDMVDNVTDKDVASYYGSAARFFKQSPWRLVQGDRVIGVRSLDFPDQQWGVSVIGQMGETLGLSITTGIDNALAMIRGTIDMADLNLISIQYGEDFDMVPSDLLVMEWRNRELASEDAFPLCLKMKPGSRKLFCPDQDELQMITMLLNELPSFLKSNTRSSAKVILQPPIGKRYSLSFEN